MMYLTEREEMKRRSLLHLVNLAVDLLKEADKDNDNMRIAETMIQTAFHKYRNLKDCPFYKLCGKNYCEREGIDLDV